MNTVDVYWQPYDMCGNQATMPDGSTVIITGWQSGDGSQRGFALTHNFTTYRFSSRADAYMAAELLATTLHLGGVRRQQG